MRTIDNVKAELRRRMRALPIQKFEIDGAPGLVVALPYSVNLDCRGTYGVDILGIPCRIKRLPERHDDNGRFCWHGLLEPLRPIPASWLIDLNAPEACEQSTDITVEVQEVERGLFCALVDGEWEIDTVSNYRGEAWEGAIRRYPNAHYTGVN